MASYIEALESAIQQYIGTPVLQRIKNNPSTSQDTYQQITEATILFIGVRSFTRKSKLLLTPEGMRALNQYFERMSSIICNNNGLIISLIGESILAVYTDSNTNHADDACTTAIECLDALAVLNQKESNSLQLDIGIGVSTGKVSLGNVGSKYKMNFTVMGDTVSLAFRLETFTLPYKSNIVISENTSRLLSNKFIFRELDRISIKGFEGQQTIFSVQS